MLAEYYMTYAEQWIMFFENNYDFNYGTNKAM